MKQPIRCPTCGERKPGTRHHVLPKRHFGNNNNHIFILCRECHTDLERYIPYALMPRAFYHAIMLVYQQHLCPMARKKQNATLFL